MSTPQANASPTEIAIRLAEPGDLRVCRMLLPETIEADRPVQYAVAESRSLGKIVGAVAWSLPPGNNAQVWRVATHVITPFRGQGIDASLLDFAAALGRLRQVRSFDHWHWVEADSDSEHAQLTLGFERLRTIFEFESIPAEVYRSLSPLLNKVRERGRIPVDASVVGLNEADLTAVATLHASQLGGCVSDLLPMLQGLGDRAYDPYLSTVLYVGRRVMGCNLFRRTGDDTGVEDATVIDPSLRNGWAMLWLACEHARRGVEQGIGHFRFTTFVRENGDRLIGARAPLKLLTQRVWLRKPIAAGPAPGDSR